MDTKRKLAAAVIGLAGLVAVAVHGVVAGEAGSGVTPSSVEVGGLASSESGDGDGDDMHW